MRILIVSLRGPTNAERRGGAQDYVRAVASPWTRAGHEVTILSAQERLPDGSQPPDSEIVGGLRVIRVGSPGSRVRPLVAEASRRAASADVVVENIMAFPLLLPWRLRDVPLVAVKHHFQGETFLRSQGLLKGTFGRAMEDVLQPLAYRGVPLVVPSRKTAEHVGTQWVGHRAPLHVIPPPVELAGVAAGDPSEVPTIVYLGALHLSRKRVDHLLTAFESVREAVPNARLLIAGDGPDRARLEAQAQASGAAVRFLGFVSDKEKAELLQRAWVFASPSLKEGFGITWIEAGAAGVPVVGYEVEGLDTVDESCAIMVEPGDVGALAGGLSRVLTDPALRQRLGAAARANAVRFDPDRASEAFLDVVKRARADAEA